MGPETYRPADQTCLICGVPYAITFGHECHSEPLHTEDNLPEPVLMAIDHAVRTAAPVFGMFRWTYDGAIPTERELVDVLRRLAADLLNNPESDSLATGRFAVRRIRHEEETEIEIVLELSTTYLEPGA